MSDSSVPRQRSSKTVLYLCQSGPILCEHCHAKKTRHDNGDCTHCERKKSSNTRVKNHKKSLKEVYNKDLACGDCTEKVGAVQDNIDTIVKQKKKQNRRVLNLEGNNNNPLEELPEIKISREINTTSDFVNSYSVMPRPITCPVCCKMIALNSVLQHFFFDHSKIPRITLKYSTTFHSLIKVSDLRGDPDCLNVFTLVNKKRFSDVDKAKTDEINFLEDSNLHMKGPLLLMAAKYSANSSKKSNEEMKVINAQDMGISEQLSTEYDLVLWLCKTIDDEIIYNMSISKEDKKLSYSFTGEATHIKQNQNTDNIATKYECLTIKGLAANKMVNSCGQVHVYITVLV